MPTNLDKGKINAIFKFPIKLIKVESHTKGNAEICRGFKNLLEVGALNVMYIKAQLVLNDKDLENDLKNFLSIS